MSESTVFKIEIILSANEIKAFLRFMEACEDDQEYDVEITMMRRLAEIGLARRRYANVYETTEVGLSLYEFRMV